MQADKAINVLKKAGYSELTLDTSASGRIAHVVYLVADGYGSDIRFYSQSTRAIRSNFKRTQNYFRLGTKKWLPTPVAAIVGFDSTSNPSMYVKVFYKKDTFINPELCVKLRRAGYPELGAKERDPGFHRNVYKLSLKGKPEYKLVTSKFSASKAVTQFVERSRSLAMANHKVIAVSQQRWAIRNYHDLKTENVQVEVLATGLKAGADKIYVKLHIENLTNHDLILNNRID